MGESLELRAPIIGEHMVANASLAVVMLKESGIPLEDISAAMGPGTTGIPVLIPGRVEKVSGTSGPSVFLDAGRSADAYEHTLAAIRALTTGKNVMVCGTAGNRDGNNTKGSYHSQHRVYLAELGSPRRRAAGVEPNVGSTVHTKAAA